MNPRTSALRRLSLVMLALGSLGFTPCLRAADGVLALYGGYRDGGNLEDEPTSETLELDGAPSAAISFDFAGEPARRYQAFASYHDTDVPLVSGTGAPAGDLSLAIAYLHVGGTNFFEADPQYGPYVAGGIGVTFLEPDGGELDTEMRPSLSLAVGYQFPLGPVVGVRLEARGYATLVDIGGDLFCSGGCIVAVEGNTLGQYEILLGLTLRL